MRGYNLNELSNLFQSVCDHHSMIGTYFYGKYKIDSVNDIKFPVLALTVNDIYVGETMTTYNINLLFADRLTHDRQNYIELQTIGSDVIVEILNVLKNRGSMIDNTNRNFQYRITPYTEQFADLCAGVVANNVELITPNRLGNCEYLCQFELC